jgi:hypothetical protein
MVYLLWPWPPTLPPPPQLAIMRVSSTKHSAHHQPHLSCGPSHAAPNSRHSLVSPHTSSYTVYLHQQPLTKATCNDTAKAYNLRGPANQPSYKLKPKLITSYLPKKSAPPTTCFALQHWPTYTPGQCTLMALVHSRCAHFRICNTCL